MNNLSTSDFKAMLAEAKLPEKTVPVCLRGDLVAEHEEVERELATAEKLADVLDSLDGGGGNIGELAERLEALEAQMREHSFTFRLRALPKPKFRALIAAHPPRQDEDGSVLPEDFLGVNNATFFDALIQTCVVEPELDADDWLRLLGPDGVLTDHQYDQLSTAAWGVNRHDVDVPFSRAASRLNRTSAPE